MGATENAGFNTKVQRIAGIYPRLHMLLSWPNSLQKGNDGTSAETQIIQLPSLYAHRSVTQRRRQVAMLMVGHQGCEGAHGESGSSRPQVWGHCPSAV